MVDASESIGAYIEAVSIYIRNIVNYPDK